MRFISRVFIFLFIFISNSIFSQSKPTSRENITLLKSGALFVRLKTSQNLINAYIKKGMLKEAEEVRLSQEIKNKAMADAFKKYYTFSKVYFFYSNYSTEIKEGRSRQHLMNTDLQVDSSFTGNYLTGEFDESQNGLKAFFIKDKNYEPLKRPFPFLIRINKMLVSTKSEDQIVQELNNRLIDFWNR